MVYAEGRIFCRPATRWLKRFFVLNNSSLSYYDNDVDYGHQSEDSKSVENGKPRSVYTLTPTSNVSDVEKGEVYVYKGLSFKLVRLFSFSVILHHKGKSITLHLGSESEEDANLWHTDLLNIIESASQLVHVLTHKVDGKASPQPTINDEGEGIDVFKGSTQQSLLSHSKNLGEDADGEQKDSDKASSQHRHRVKPATYRLVSSAFDVRVLEELADPGTFIILTTIDAHPHTVFEEFQLMVTGVDSPFNVLGDSYGYSVQEVNFLDTSDKNRDIVHAVFANPWSFLCPREIVIERFWRLDEEGVYTMTFSSVENDAVPNHPRPISTLMCDSSTPLRLEIEGGITISPLKEGLAGEACLVHYVVKIKSGGGVIERIVGQRSHVFDTWLLSPFISQVAHAKSTLKFARFNKGALTVMERLAQFEGESRANESARKQLALGASIKVVLAVNKFKKMLHKSSGKERPKGVQISSNLSRDMWYDPGAVNFHVRGPDYFNDRVKVQSSSPVMSFCALELFKCDQPKNLHLISQRPDHPLNTPEAVNGPFTVVVNLMIPGPPHLNVVMYFRPSNFEMLDDEDNHWGRTWKNFINGDDTEKNSRIKLIPSISQGGWMIKQAVGTTPVIIGQKLATTYHSGANYMEIDIDISCSKVACKVTGMCLGVTKSLTIDLGFVLEPHSQEELPERLLGTVRFKNIDLSQAQDLELETKKEK